MQKNKGKLYLRKGDYEKANKTFDQVNKDAKKYAQEFTRAEILLYKSKIIRLFSVASFFFFIIIYLWIIFPGKIHTMAWQKI